MGTVKGMRLVVVVVAASTLGLLGAQAWAAEKGTAPTPGTGSGLAHLGAALEGTGRIANTEVQPARVDVGAATPDDPARAPRPDAQRADDSVAQAEQQAGF